MAQVAKEKETKNIVSEQHKANQSTAENWNAKIEKAIIARKVGRELRKGKAPGLSNVQRTRL